MIGTVNTVEVFLTAAVSAAFVAALLAGHWAEADGLMTYVWAVSSLIAGVVIAASMAGYVTRFLPQKYLMMAVGALISLLAVYQNWRLL